MLTSKCANGFVEFESITAILLSWSDFTNLVVDLLIHQDLILMLCRWWWAWQWRSFQIRRRRRGKRSFLFQVVKYSNVHVFAGLKFYILDGNLHDQFQAAGGRVERRLCGSESSSSENLQASVQGASCQAHQLIKVTQWSRISSSSNSNAFSDHYVLIKSRALLPVFGTEKWWWKSRHSENNEQQK